MRTVAETVEAGHGRIEQRRLYPTFRILVLIFYEYSTP
jgi:hypothetical protein